MKQKLQDLIVLIRHDRKWQALVGILILMILFTFMVDSNTTRRRYAKKTVDNIGATSSDEASDEMLKFFEERNRKIEQQLRNIQEASELDRQKTKEYEDRTAQIFQKLIERVRQNENFVGTLGTSKSPETVTDTFQDDLQPFGNATTAKLVEPPIQPENREAIIPAASSVRVKLLAGANAPTDGTPYPIILETVSDVYGPDGSSLPVGNSRIIAAAQGSLIDQRALFRLTKMSTRYPDGSIQEVDIDGWLVGEDGIRGMEGILIDPIGKVLAGGVVAGTVGGAGQALAQGNVQTNVNNAGVFSNQIGDTGEFALGQGLTGASRIWQDYVQERAKLLVPHVKVLSGREATAVFSQSVAMPGLYEAIDESSLDLDYLD